MSKTYAALCLLLILVLLAGCGTRIIPAVPTITPSAPPAEVPPPPTPTPLLSPPPEAVNPSPQISPTPRVSTSQLPVQRHFPPQLPESWQEEPTAAETVARPDTYTVNRGDCLWTIAEELYGSGSAWRRLWAANREAVADPALVWVGQVLKLPEETG